MRENVRFGLRMERVNRRESEVRAADALTLVGLEDFGDRMPPQLSGGQAQRVAVARALVKRPAVLLLDEPLGALDLKLRHRLQIELSQIHREVGTTFVYVTHDQEEAMSMADRIAVFSDGMIEQLGTPARDLPAPVDPLRRRLHRRVELLRCDGRRRRGRDDGRHAHAMRGRSPAGPGDADGAARGDLAGRATATAERRRAAGRALQASFLGSYVRVAVDSAAAEAPVMVAAAQPGRGDGADRPRGRADVAAAATGILLEPRRRGGRR